MKALNSLYCFAALALAMALLFPGSAKASALVAPGSLAERIAQVDGQAVVDVQYRARRGVPRYGAQRWSGRHGQRWSRPRVHAGRPLAYRYSHKYHGPRYRARRPGFHYYGGWWYSFPWWLGVAPPRYYQPAPPRARYAGRCEYWHQQCVRNWGYGNSNYRGCMRYHRCW